MHRSDVLFFSVKDTQGCWVTWRRGRSQRQRSWANCSRTTSRPCSKQLQLDNLSSVYNVPIDLLRVCALKLMHRSKHFNTHRHICVHHCDITVVLADHNRTSAELSRGLLPGIVGRMLDIAGNCGTYAGFPPCVQVYVFSFFPSLYCSCDFGCKCIHDD